METPEARYAATGPSQRHNCPERAPPAGWANPVDQQDRAVRRRGGEQRVSAAGGVQPAGGPGNQGRPLAAPAVMTSGLAVIIPGGRPVNCLRDGVIRDG